MLLFVIANAVFSSGESAEAESNLDLDCHVGLYDLLAMTSYECSINILADFLMEGYDLNQGLFL